jgi:hypothetical protein
VCERESDGGREGEGGESERQRQREREKREIERRDNRDVKEGVYTHIDMFYICSGI